MYNNLSKSNPTFPKWLGETSMKKGVILSGPLCFHCSPEQQVQHSSTTAFQSPSRTDFWGSVCRELVRNQSTGLHTTTAIDREHRFTDLPHFLWGKAPRNQYNHTHGITYCMTLLMIRVKQLFLHTATRKIWTVIWWVSTTMQKKSCQI